MCESYECTNDIIDKLSSWCKYHKCRTVGCDMKRQDYVWNGFTRYINTKYCEKCVCNYRNDMWSSICVKSGKYNRLCKYHAKLCWIKKCTNHSVKNSNYCVSHKCNKCYGELDTVRSGKECDYCTRCKCIFKNCTNKHIRSRACADHEILLD